jgi:protein-tyrosine phosphatase
MKDIRKSMGSWEKKTKHYAKKYWRDKLWNVYGRGLLNPEAPSHVRSLIFVCKGNICRSPFAEHIAYKQLKHSVSQVHILSAGLEVDTPQAPPEAAIDAGRCFDVDLSMHKSRSFIHNELSHEDMVIVMEGLQLKKLQNLYPEKKSIFYLLPLFCIADGMGHGGFKRWNIPDPYGKNTDGFIECYKRIEYCVRNLTNRIYNKI